MPRTRNDVLNILREQVRQIGFFSLQDTLAQFCGTLSDVQLTALANMIADVQLQRKLGMKHTLEEMPAEIGQ